MTGTAIDTEAAVELAKSAVDILPEEGKTVVLEHLLSEMAPEALQALSPEARQRLQQALPGTEAAPSATTSPAVGEIKKIDGYNAVVGQITVNGQQLDTLLSKGSFNKSRVNQVRYAGEFGGDRPYRMATREENRAYVEGLLAKAGNGTINDAEKNALQTYRKRFVRDTGGGLDVDGRRVRVNDSVWYDYAYPRYGALFVRASAESK